MMTLPRSPWHWVLFVAVIVQGVMSLMLLTGDYSHIIDAVRRDIRIVAVLTLVSSLIASACLPTALESKATRRLLLVSVIVTGLAMIFAVIAGALTGWVIFPSIVMAFGMLLLYRELATSRSSRPQD